MRKTNKIILFTLIIVVLLLGVGYAAIQNVTLNITGTAAADPSQSNFKVMFTGTPVVSDSNYVTATITDDTKATLNVSGLTTKGQTVTVEYLVQNISTDLSSDLAVSVVNSNTEYFRITSELAKTSLTAGEVTTLTLTIELIKTPLTEVSSTIGTQLESMPVQPGEEGSSGLTNDFSQDPEKPTLSLVTNDNIGDYIDLGNDIVRTESTADDWRVLYVENDTVYAILSSVVPAGFMDFSSMGFSISVPNSVLTGEQERISTQLLALLNSQGFNVLTNGIEGAIASGATSAEMIMDSYNAKNKTNFAYTNSPILDATSEDFDLYITEEGMISGSPKGYWTSTRYDTDSVWVVSHKNNSFVIDKGNVSNGNYVRPVVALPQSLECELVNGVWKIIR